MSVSLKKQELPPAGGYAPINYKRIPPKSFFGAFSIFGIYLAVTAVGLGLYGVTKRRRKREEVEMRSARLAIVPLLIAEQDRQFLIQMRRNRDVETELMKDVEGWEVGTLYGERVYRSLPEDSIWVPTDMEWYAHTSQAEWWKRMRIPYVL